MIERESVQESGGGGGIRKSGGVNMWACKQDIWAVRRMVVSGEGGSEQARERVRERQREIDTIEQESTSQRERQNEIKQARVRDSER